MAEQPPTSPKLAAIQKGFEESLPCIMRVAKFRLRGLTGEAKDDAIAEVVALSWQSYRRLAEQGRDPPVPKIAEFSSRRVRCGRGLANPNPVQESLSATCRHRHGYDIESIPLSSEDACDPALIDALVDDRISPADEAAFKIDTTEWLAGLGDRNQQIADQLMAGLYQSEVAELHGVSRMRIYQLRQDMADEWRRFFGDESTL